MMEFLPTLLWRPSLNFSSRRGTRVDLLVLHDAKVVTRAPSDGSNCPGRVCRRTTWSARTGVRQRKWSTLPTMPGMRALSIGAPLASRWVASRVVVLMRLCLQLARMCSPFLCYHLRIPIQHARAGVGPGIASHKDPGPAGGGHHDPSDDPTFMQRFIGLVAEEHRKGHFPEVWDPRRAQRARLLSPDKGSPLSPVTSLVPPLPDVHTISGLQEALKMLGYRIAVDGDYGAETRQAVTSFQMRTGIVADGVAGAQTEAKLLSDLNRMREMDGHLPR
jgi:hypothetical protein